MSAPVTPEVLKSNVEAFAKSKGLTPAVAGLLTSLIDFLIAQPTVPSAPAAPSPAAPAPSPSPLVSPPSVLSPASPAGPFAPNGPGSAQAGFASLGKLPGQVAEGGGVRSHGRKSACKKAPPKQK